MHNLEYETLDDDKKYKEYIKLYNFDSYKNLNEMKKNIQRKFQEIIIGHGID